MCEPGFLLSRLALPPAQAESAEQEEDPAHETACDRGASVGEDLAGPAGRRWAEGAAGAGVSDRPAGAACGLAGRVGRALAGGAAAVADLAGRVGRALAGGAAAVADLAGRV